MHWMSASRVPVHLMKSELDSDLAAALGICTSGCTAEPRRSIRCWSDLKLNYDCMLSYSRAP